MAIFPVLLPAVLLRCLLGNSSSFAALRLSGFALNPFFFVTFSKIVLCISSAKLFSFSQSFFLTPIFLVLKLAPDLETVRSGHMGRLAAPECLCLLALVGFYDFRRTVVRSREKGEWAICIIGSLADEPPTKPEIRRPKSERIPKPQIRTPLSFTVFFGSRISGFGVREERIFATSSSAPPGAPI